MDKRLVLLAAITAITLLSGCLGSGGGSDKPKEPMVNTGTLTLTNRPTGLAQAQPVDINSVVDINLDFQNVIMITVIAIIEDGDDGTNPDQIGTLTLMETDGNHTTTSNGGSTGPEDPFEANLTINWDGTNYMTDRWQLDMTVTINGGDDTWIGPFLWVGTPDNGFTYTLDITYQYHEEEM